GRKVPVPCSTTGKAPCCAATAERWARTSGSALSSMSIGGIRVMCGGMWLAIGSKMASRYSCSSARQGSGSVIATPMVVMGLRSCALSPRDEAECVVGIRESLRRHLARTLGPRGEDPVQLTTVGHQLQGAVAEGGDEVDDHLGQLALEVA